VQRAAGSALEARAVQEDACPVDDARRGASLVGEHAACLRLRVVLEERWVEGGRQRRDGAGLVAHVEVGAERAAPLAEVLGRLRQDAEAAAAVQAGPPGLEEAHVEAPGGLPVDDLLPGAVAHGGTVPTRRGFWPVGDGFV
jgi:hypothetical protein